MASFGGRNVSRVLPRLLKAVDRQRQLSTFVPRAGVWASQSHGLRLISTQLQSHEPGQKFTSNEDEMIDRMLYNLDLSIRRRGRVMRVELDKIMNLIERTGVCTSNQALLVIKCCGDVLVDLDKKSRIEIADRCFKLLKLCENTVLDISHYNALMKVHLENNNKVSVSDLLSAIEQKNLGPNRVTYQLCVALLCQQGDISGATAILQHMKKENLAINEAVFHSLLSAHCANHDKDSVVATLDVMANSGLNIGAETYTVIASSYARTGQWEQVTKTLEQAEMENISFTDSDILAIIQSCSEAGLKDEARSLIEKLPKKRGFFQEVRNSVPQLALNGNIDTAVDLYVGLKNRDGFVKEGQGMFVVSSITRADVDIDTLLSAVAKLEEDGFTTAKQFMVQEAAYNWSPEKCQQLAGVLYQEEGREIEIVEEQLYNFIRGYMEHKKDLDKALQFINNLKTLKVKIPDPVIASDIIPLAMESSRNKLPSKVVKELQAALPHFSYNFISNSMITFLLNKVDQDHFLSTVGFLLNVNTFMVKPDNWNSSLARSFLHTNDSESFISCLTSAYFSIKSSKVKGDRDDRPLKMDRLFRSLYHIGAQAHIIQPGVAVDDLLAPLLQELINLKIGVPNESKTEKDLIAMLKKEESKELLKQATKVFAENQEYWTDEEGQKFLETRKKLWADRMRGQRPDIEGERRKLVNYKEISSKEELEQVQSLYVSNGNANVVISSKLLTIYLNEGNVSKFAELFNYTKSKKEFALAPSDVDSLVELLVKEGKAKEAQDWVLKLHGDGNPMLYSSLMKCLSALAEEGDHAAVIATLEKINPEGLLSKGALTNKLLSVYSNRGEADHLHEVSTFLLTNNFASADNNDNLVANIDVYMEQNDLTKAVAEFTRIAKVYKKCPRKFQLTRKLIEEENAEAIQEVLEASSGIVGEDRSILDLAHSFLHLGKKVQARKLIDTPGLRYFEDRFSYIFDQLAKENPDNAEAFVQITKNVFNCDRDLLYTKLVHLNSKDVDKVDDVWLQVQEEGLVPSNRLMRAIGNVFKEHGREVPFGDIPEEEEASVKKATGRRRGSKSQTGQSSTAPNKYASFSQLIQQDKLEEASDMAVDICSEQSERAMRKNYVHFQELFRAWDAKGDVDAIEEFIKSVDDRANAVVKASAHYKSMLLKHNPDGYLELIKTDEDNLNKLVVNGSALVESVEKNPSLQDKIDQLAIEGNITATLLSAKLSLHQKNAEKLLKSFEKATSLTSDKVYSRIFDKVDSMDKVRMSLDIVGSNEACIVRILENALVNLKDDTPATSDLARLAVERGLNTSHFSKAALNPLSEETVSILTGSKVN